jgi:lipoprotein-releasing system ATP-binding protein
MTQPLTKPAATAPPSASQSIILRVENLHKTYHLDRVNIPVLRGVSLELRDGEFLAILGASGSGKSTLLHLMGGLDTPDREPKPSIIFRDKEVTRFSAGELDLYRRTDAGFIFQFYHLLPELNILENVAIGRMIRSSGESKAERTATSEAILKQVGLGHRLLHRPAELSGGERQRVAIARALVNEPAILLADEPTGNLDAETGRKILDLLEEVRRERRQTMVVVTHDAATAARADRVIRLSDGRTVTG